MAFDGSKATSSAGTSAPDARPRVWIVPDEALEKMELREILEAASCCVIEPAGNAGFAGEPAPGLVIAAIRAAGPQSLEHIRALRADANLGTAPILGVTVDSAEADLDALRALGVVGLIDSSALPQHVVFRINQLLRPGPERRRWDRVVVELPVTLDVDGESSEQTAVSLSAGGLGVRSQRPVEPNSDVRLRFQLGEAPRAELDVEGRVMHCSRGASAGAGYRLGIFFFSIGDAERGYIAVEVERLQELGAAEA